MHHPLFNFCRISDTRNGEGNVHHRLYIISTKIELLGYIEKTITFLTGQNILFIIIFSPSQGLLSPHQNEICALHI